MLLHINQIFEITQFNITDGALHEWKCFPNAQSVGLSSQHAVATAVFSRTTGEVYTLEIHKPLDDEGHSAYRWITPAYKDTYYVEALKWGYDPDEAWDDVKWHDVEFIDDYLEKFTAIFNGEQFDTRILVGFDLTEPESFKLMKMAHEMDITLNQLINNILTEFLDSDDAEWTA